MGTHMDAKRIWQAALERVRRRVSPGVYSSWFSGTAGVDLSGAELTVAVPSAFAGEHLRQRYYDMTRVAVSEVIGERASITFVIREQPPAPSPRRPLPTSGRARSTRVAQQTALAIDPRPAPTSRNRSTAASIAQPALVAYHEPAQPKPTYPSQRPALRVPAPSRPTRVSGELSAAPHDLHPRYVFDTYIIGAANRLAFAAAQEVATFPGEQYNPLFVYGGVGLGKTHLLHAIGHRARANGLSVAYVTAERFTNEIIEAIRLRATEEFRRRYRAVDVLLVDDVQFIAGKESTEEEFFHTFNALHDANKQIVLSSDRVPQSMHHLHDRLRSRFSWGLIADIQPPDYQQRVEILRARAESLRIPLPEDALVCLARPECENIRALEGALNRVVAHAQMLNQPLDIRLVAQAMAPLAGHRGEERPVDCDAVLSAVARHFTLTPEALRGKSREHGVAWARQVAMHILREETSSSLLQIGQFLGGRDHTTVMHGCARVGEQIAKDERARSDVSLIRASLRA